LLPSAIRQIDTTEGRGLLPSGQVEAALLHSAGVRFGGGHPADRVTR
jgi:hypothetical protein